MASLRDYENILRKKPEAVKKLKKTQFCVWKSVKAGGTMFVRGNVHLNIEQGVAHDAKSKSLIFCPEIPPRLNVVWFFSWNVFFVPKKKIGKTSFGPTRLKPGVVDRTESNPVGRIVGSVIEHNRTGTFRWVR